MSEVELSKMVNIVFANPPGNANSYKLDLSVGDGDVEMTDEVLDQLSKTTSRVLMNIFITGCGILFGDSVSPGNMTEEQFQLINKYINSFGYNTHYEYTYNDNKVATKLEVYFNALEN